MRRSRGNSTDTPTRNPFLPSQIETAVVEDNYNQTMERTAYHFFDENVDDSMCSGASNTNGNQHARLSAPGSAGDPGPGNDCNFLSSRSGKFLEECLDMGLLGSGRYVCARSFVSLLLLVSWHALSAALEKLSKSKNI